MARQSINQETMLLMQLSRDLIGLLENAESFTQDQTTAIKRHLNGLQRALELGRENFNRMSQEERLDIVIGRLAQAKGLVEELRSMAQAFDKAQQ